jgi:antibiotic biosynthesis monooxygenase (ABM) superfamily enzyme
MTVTGSDGITVVVAREVAPGRETEFHRWGDDELLTAAARFPGFLGAWEGSPVRTRLLAAGSEFVQSVAVRRLDGMEAWFEPPPSRPSGPPPRWKTFLMTASVILVLQTILAALLRPLVGDWPTFLRTAAVIVPLVALMTWVVMPRLSRLLAGSLYRTTTEEQR